MCRCIFNIIIPCTLCVVWSTRLCFNIHLNTTLLLFILFVKCNELSTSVLYVSSQWYSELPLLYICICFSKTRFFFFESTVMLENLNSLAGYKYKINTCNMTCASKLKLTQMKPCIHVTK